MVGATNGMRGIAIDTALLAPIAAAVIAKVMVTLNGALGDRQPFLVMARRQRGLVTHE
jgi:hypothetical protein